MAQCPSAAVWAFGADGHCDRDWDEVRRNCRRWTKGTTAACQGRVSWGKGSTAEVHRIDERRSRGRCGQEAIVESRLSRQHCMRRAAIADQGEGGGYDVHLTQDCRCTASVV